MAKKHMRIRSVAIETLPPRKMRYRTVGDWFFRGEKNDHLVIQVADTGNWTYNLMVAIHELVEVFLCCLKGITTEQVDRFDKAHEDDEDPGSHPRAPYHRQHMSAMSVEIMLCAAAGVKWRKYEDSLDAAWKKTPKS
jgi:hypothetical protein